MTFSTALTFPKLRAVDVRPYVQNGHSYYLLRDPLALAEGSLLVPQSLGPALMLCDGTLENTQAMVAALAIRYGIRLNTDAIDDLLVALDNAMLLDNERSQEALARQAAAYRQRPYRPLALAGHSYPDDPEVLAQQLNRFLLAAREEKSMRSTPSLNGHAHNHLNGRSHLPAAAAAASCLGIFSPHIDYGRGSSVYAHTWGAIQEAVEAADLVIAIGTDHFGDDLFTLTRQNYATPYGILPTATRVVDDLAQALGEETAYAGELRHCQEHSLELVAVWLHHMRSGVPVEVAPVLCGSFYGFYGNQQGPASHPAIATFLETLNRHCEGRRVLIVASGDLAHVGPAFGGTPLTAQDRLKVRQADRTLINHLCAGDAEGFFNAIRRVRNQFNVCGGAPGYLALKLMGAVTGAEMAYQSCPADDQNTSAVTISGIVFHA
jgi:MEMO1 family protein